MRGTNRILAAVFAGGLSLLMTVGIPSGVAIAAEDEAATAAFDDGLLRWLLRSRWWRQTPGQPDLPVLSAILHDRMTVTWTAPESPVFEILDYDVQYRTTGASRFTDWEYEGTATEATITGLAEVTEYRIRVRAVSEVGEGDWSITASGTTLVAPPRFVEGESADRELEENTQAGQAIGEPVKATVRSGSIRYSLGGPDGALFEIDASSGQLRTRRGVDYDHERRSSYQVEVQATNVRFGTGRILVRIAVLDVDEPPDKPDRPTVTASGSTGLRVNWVAPSNTGPMISGYDVEYREDGTDEYLDAGHERTTTSVTITGLARQTLYEIRVRATNDEGTGAWSDTALGGTAGAGGGTSPEGPYAPASQRAFDTRFVGNFMSTESYFVRFLSNGRFRRNNDHPGAYTYENTGSNTGTVTQTYDDAGTFGGSCTIRLTFASETSGTTRYTCDGGQVGGEEWRMDVVDSGAFNIEIIPVGTRRSSVDSAFRAAVARWERVISGDTDAVYIPSLRTVDDLFGNGSTDKIFGVIDDLRIYARIASIDGPGGTLARAGAAFVRISSDLPAVSLVTLDLDDIGRFATTDLRGVVLHEVAHTLGFGTRWDNLGLLANPSIDEDGEPISPVPDTHFTGSEAIVAFDAVGGTGYTGEKVPVENMGGPGTADAHWRNSVFGIGELMNGYRILGSRTAEAMSLVTIQSMADLGYVVDVEEADNYRLPFASSSTARSRATEEFPGSLPGTLLGTLIPLKCIVTKPLRTDEVRMIEIQSVRLQ